MPADLPATATAESLNAVWITLITAVGAIVASIIGAIVTLRTVHARVEKTKVAVDEAKAAIVETKTEMSAMHVSVNSKMDALLKAATELAEIRGMLKEREAVAALNVAKETAKIAGREEEKAIAAIVNVKAESMSVKAAKVTLTEENKKETEE